MALHVCNAVIAFSELRGPKNTGIKQKEYCRFECKECHLDCLRVRDLPNSAWQSWASDVESELEVIQSGITKTTHAQICTHPVKMCTAANADYQTLIQELLKNSPAGTIISNLGRREFIHFSCECGLNVNRYREIGTFMNGAWEPLKNLLVRVPALQVESTLANAVSSEMSAKIPSVQVTPDVTPTPAAKVTPDVTPAPAGKVIPDVTPAPAAKVTAAPAKVTESTAAIVAHEIF